MMMSYTRPCSFSQHPGTFHIVRKTTVLLLSILIMLIKQGVCYTNICTGFDPGEKLCCGGVLHSIRLDISPMSCCGQSLYDSASQSCCNDEIIDHVTSPTLDCCGQTDERVYDTDSQICCMGTLENKTQDSACCGSTVMDSSSQTCCYNGVVNAPRDGLGSCCGVDKLFNPETEICCERHHPTSPASAVYGIGHDAVIEGDFKCCGLTAMNTTEKRCCNEAQKDKTPYNDCCNGMTFDTRSQICCGGAVRDLTNGETECCDTNAFNPANQVCCSFGYVVYNTGHGSCCRTMPYSNKLDSCCRGIIQHVPQIYGVQGCCGGDSYLKTDQVCCEGKLHSRQLGLQCCGTELYNTTSELCCGDTTIPRSTPSLQCCGDTSYDPLQQTCCPHNGQIFPGLNLSCCYSTRLDTADVYNPQNQTCCRGRRDVSVYPESNSNMKCCGESLLQDNQLCDRALRQPIAKEHADDNAVCRSTRLRTGRTRQGGPIQTYNQETHVCTTNGEVFLRMPGEQICGQKLFDPASELCCGGRIFFINDQYGNPRECCGNSVFVYAPSLQCCFGSRVENIPQNVAGLCRNIAYNVNTSTCYRNSVVRPRSEVDNYPDLCSTGSDPSLWIPYNPRDNECCGDTLIGLGQTCCSRQVYATPGTTIGSGRCCRNEGGYNPATDICCNGRLFPTNGTDMECCGNRPFDQLDGSEICCGDRLHSSSSGQMLCTDGTAHSPMETVCDGVLYGVANGDCCGKSIMNDTTTCCDGHIYSKVDHGTHCCGRVAYNPMAQTQPLCCGDSLYTNAQTLECCGNEAIDTTVRQCCGTVGNQFAFLRSSGQACCGGSDDFDETQDTCCQGLLHKYIADGECCGQEIVRDPSKEICCDGRIQSKDYGDHTICCNNIIRDARRVICCGNASVSRQSRWQECCNGIVVNKGQHQCPDTDIQTRGLEDTSRRGLEDTSRRGLEDTTHRIFARQTEHAQRVAENATDAIDLGIEQTTNADRRMVHVEPMMPRDSTEVTGVVCNGLAYDPDTQGCCYGTLYKLTNETCMDGLIGGVCDGIAYNPSTQGCCGVTVFNRTTEYCDEIVSPSADVVSEIGDGTQPTLNATLRPLCGGVIYDQLQHGCCGDQLYNLSSENCGEAETVIPKILEQPDEVSTIRLTTISSYETSTLPDSTVYPEISEEECNILRAQENVTDEYQCCQSLLYSPENATCCQGITSSDDGSMVIWSAVTVGVSYGRCCDLTAYDSSVEVCCNERILAKTWFTPDVFNNCCKPGEQWNRLLDSCETAPTYEPIMDDETSGMSPED